MLLDAYPPRTPISKYRPAQRYPRTLVTVPVTLRHLMTGRIRSSRGISLDVSQGGLGAIVQGELLVGETVEIDFCLSERTLSTVAIVRHTSNLRSGFEFLGLTPEERQQIADATGNC